jgi:exodeoxyribonuclease III
MGEGRRLSKTIGSYGSALLNSYCGEAGEAFGEGQSHRLLIEYRPVKFATWNINSVIARLPLLLKWLDVRKPDVVCLQETKVVDERFPVAEFAEIGYRCQTFGQASYNGVAVLARSECEPVHHGLSKEDAETHARLLATTIDGIRIVNVYIPNGQSVGSDKYTLKLNWMKQLRTFFDLNYTSAEQVLLCGDFNVAPDNIDVYAPEVWQGRILFSDPERAALREIKEWGFVDAFRLHHEEGKQFSWWDYRAGSFRRNLGLRIDHIWVSEPLAARCIDAYIDKEPRGWERPSDHAPVLAEFAPGAEERTPMEPPVE